MDENNPYTTPSVNVTPTPTNSDAGAVNSPYGPMQNTKALSVWVRVILAIQLLATLLIGLVALRSALVASAGNDPFWRGEEINPLGLADIGLSLFFFISYIPTIVLFCIWTNKSMKNAWAMRQNPYQTLMTPGWAVGYYFIPFLLLWKPFQGMREIWEVSFRNQKSLGLLRWWWGFWLLDNFAGNISFRLPTDSLEDLILSGFFDASTTLFSLAGGVLLFIIVGKVTKRQMESYKRRSS